MIRRDLLTELIHQNLILEIILSSDVSYRAFQNEFYSQCVSEYSFRRWFHNWCMYSYNKMPIIMAISFSLLITFIFHCVLYEKRASNSLFQHIMADTCHHRFLFVSCPINWQGMHLWKIIFLYFILLMYVTCLLK